MFDETSYCERVFEDIQLHDVTIERVLFEQCTFNRCQFDQTLFERCQFEHCTFSQCSFKESRFHQGKLATCQYTQSNLAMVKLVGTEVHELDFRACKLPGINWTEVRFPYVVLESPMYFEACDISYSSFFELNLPSAIFTECKAHEVDFRGSELCSADFSGASLDGAQFVHTNLKSADFRGATGYVFSPVDNKLLKAQFSHPEVVGLLQCFQITVE